MVVLIYSLKLFSDYICVHLFLLKCHFIDMTGSSRKLFLILEHIQKVLSASVLGLTNNHWKLKID